MKDFIKNIDKNLDKIKDKMISILGGDEGHDIGDSGNGLELLSNIITEHSYDVEYLKALKESINESEKKTEEILFKLRSLTSKEWGRLHQSLYPNTQAYSGFGNAW